MPLKRSWMWNQLHCYRQSRPNHHCHQESELPGASRIESLSIPDPDRSAPHCYRAPRAFRSGCRWCCGWPPNQWAKEDHWGHIGWSCCFLTGWLRQFADLRCLLHCHRHWDWCSPDGYSLFRRVWGCCCWRCSSPALTRLRLRNHQQCHCWNSASERVHLHHQSSRYWRWRPRCTEQMNHCC